MAAETPKTCLVCSADILPDDGESGILTCASDPEHSVCVHTSCAKAYIDEEARKVSNIML
jgi:hypothetical protein